MARLCVANAMDGAGRKARDLVIPHCTYTDPEVATVGLTPVRAAEVVELAHQMSTIGYSQLQALIGRH